jgi:hypothetical protein
MASLPKSALVRSPCHTSHLARLFLRINCGQSQTLKYTIQDRSEVGATSIRLIISIFLCMVVMETLLISLTTYPNQTWLSMKPTGPCLKPTIWIGTRIPQELSSGCSITPGLVWSGTYSTTSMNQLHLISPPKRLMKKSICNTLTTTHPSISQIRAKIPRWWWQLACKCSTLRAKKYSIGRVQDSL